MQLKDREEQEENHGAYTMKIFSFMTGLLGRPASEHGANGSLDRQDIRPLTDALADVEKSILKFNSSTEEGFVSMGEKLKDYHARSNSLFESSRAVVEIMTGPSLNSVTEGLSELLDGLKVHISESEENLSKISRELERYLQGLRKTSSSLEGFETLVLSLEMLGFLTRVENAHVYTATTGFASLTDDVKKLALNIRQKTHAIRDQAMEARSVITGALSRIDTYRKGTGARAGETLDTTRKNHDLLKDKFVSASEAARLMSEKTSQATNSIAEIVMSLQFHDITRQQVAHVGETTHSLKTKVEKPGDDAGVRLGIMAEVLRLQKSQLNHAKQELTTAVETVKENLFVITKSLEDVLGETRDVAWASGTEGVSFMDSLDSGIASVMESLDTNAREQSSLTGMVGEAGAMVSDMSKYVQEIDSLGMNLQLIALNARIRAAGIGAEGAALDIISGSIYELSKDARDDTHGLSELLMSLVSESGSFVEDLKLIQEHSKEKVESMVERLHELTSSLHDINDMVLSNLGELTGTGSAILSEISLEAGRITVHEEAGELLDGIVGIMDETASRAATLAPGHHEKEAAAFLSEIGERYTMESEWEVHVRHTDQGGPDPVRTVRQANGNDLGDNVELF